MNDKGLDNLWSLAVRYRDNCSCQICGIVYPHDDMADLHSHHIFKKSRGKGLRWDIDNGVSLCFTCHYKAELSDEWFWDRMIPRLPHERFEVLSAKITEARKSTSGKLDRREAQRRLTEQLAQFKDEYADHRDACQLPVNHNYKPG